MAELHEHLKTPGHRRAAAEQQRLVGEVQFHLRERGVDVTDRDVWQHGVANGPFAGSEEWAGSALATLAHPDTGMVCSCDRCTRRRESHDALGDQVEPGQEGGPSNG